ncbi:sensor domain-containing diguanylate cyclase [Paenibacillus sp. MMS20-IR301]|uniref:sensor domain-containing diguanylate cyclase n=1 Tax=Paenibacillus sp. MMS20-IR301 TaxID=2895946 RepID=UPI0028E1F95F|nr:sensor domain-containing diguanylate cyclase [Paenibacillus sp. MMS20-IR301]WNS42390.1 sensor domain-containing diguanylate cyclase [Paenibacillus sp. MMS20-IR301]
MDKRLEYAPCGYVAITHEGMITEMNQTFLDSMGYEREDLAGKHLESLMSKANRLVFHSYFYPNINLNGHVDELFLSLKDHNGQSIPYILNGRRYENEGIEIIDCVLVQMAKRMDYEQELRSAKKQIEEAYWEKDQALAKLKQLHTEIEQKQSELLELNAILVELSTTDKLTGLRNRRYFQEVLTEHIKRSDESGEPFSLLILDIDHFKRVNDTLGHPMGDHVLEQMGSLLSYHSREQDIAARYGGEEFVLLLPGINAPESIMIAENIRHEIEHAVWDTEIIRVMGGITASLGVATFTGADPEPEASLLHKADQALYASKEQGRNRVTHSMDSSALSL